MGKNEDETIEYFIYRISLTLITLFGFLNNFMFFIVLCLRSLKSKYTNCILRNQSIIDSSLCLITLLALNLPKTSSSGILFIDQISCSIWTGQYLEYCFILAGEYNLVFTAVDRFWAVVTPSFYQKNINRKIILSFVFIYTFPVIFNWPQFIEFRLINGTCNSDYSDLGPNIVMFFKVNSTMWVLFQYIIPVAIIIFLYWKVYKAMNKLKSNNEETKKATMKFTKATMIVVIIFMLTCFFDPFYYMLGYLGAVEYVFNSPLQLTGISLITINSAVNPVVYFITMKSFRKFYFDVFCRCRKRSNAIETSVFE
uniref:GCR145 n=1 Tax=Schmidtea mediterranea TaxID=79327 RepID=A0A193KUF5_SCHMD|nr:GCR145 [Schmidtea mediterranea]